MIDHDPHNLIDHDRAHHYPQNRPNAILNQLLKRNKRNKKPLRESDFQGEELHGSFIKLRSLWESSSGLQSENFGERETGDRIYLVSF